MTIDDEIKALDEDPYLMVLALTGEAMPILRRGAAVFALRQVWVFGQKAGLSYDQIKAILKEIDAEVKDQYFAAVLENAQPTTTN